MFGLTTTKKAKAVATAAYDMGFAAACKWVGFFLFIFFLFFVPFSEAQFSWPTYPVTSPIQIYKAAVADGGLAIQADSDSLMFIGITQAAVVTSTGNVPMAVSGASQIQVGSTTTPLGTLVTSDADGNATPFNPTQDGNVHCVLGQVIAGNTAPGGFIYIRVLPFCYQTSSGGGGAVTSVFGRTGAVVAESGDYTCAEVTNCIYTFFGNSTNPLTALADPTTIVDTHGNNLFFSTNQYGFSDTPGDLLAFNPNATPSIGNTFTVADFVGNTFNFWANNSVCISFSACPVQTNNSMLLGPTSGGNGVFIPTLRNWAPLASPSFSGTPTAPTASAGTNTTQLATTAFVQSAISSQNLCTISACNVTGSSSSISTTTLFTPIISGMYKIGFYISQVAACTNVVAGAIDLTMTFTDDAGNGATTFQPISSPLAFQTSSGLPNNLAENGNPTSFTGFLISGQPITYSTTYTACATGTATYNLHFTIIKN